MLTTKFKISAATVLALVIAGGLTANQLVQEQQLQTLQNELMTRPKVVRVIVTPTASPTASPTATLKFLRPVVTAQPTK